MPGSVPEEVPVPRARKQALYVPYYMKHVIVLAVLRVKNTLKTSQLINTWNFKVL